MSGSSRPGSKSGDKKDRTPIWKRDAPAPRKVSTQTPPLAPGERPPFQTSFGITEGLLSQPRQPSKIRERGPGATASSVAAVGPISPPPPGGIPRRGSKGNGTPINLNATTTGSTTSTTTSPAAKRPPLMRTASLSSPSGVSSMPTTGPLSPRSMSVKRMSLQSPKAAQAGVNAALSYTSKIPQPKSSSSSGIPPPQRYQPSYSAPRKGSSNNQSSSKDSRPPPSVEEDPLSDDPDIGSSPDVSPKKEFGRDEVKRMLAERRAEREAREREDAAFMGHPPPSSSSSSTLRGSSSMDDALMTGHHHSRPSSSHHRGSVSGGRERSLDDRQWLAEQNRKLEEAQSEREEREEYVERIRMEKDAKQREEDEERHQKTEEEDTVRAIVMERLNKGGSKQTRVKLEESWKAQLDAEFVIRRRQAEEIAESKFDEERRKRESDDTKQRLIEDQQARAEESKRMSGEAENQRREAEEYAQLARGMELTKVANQKLIGGAPRKCMISLIRLAEPGSAAQSSTAATATGPWAVRWESKRKKSLGEAMMLLEDCDLAIGIQHGNFRNEKTAKQFAESEGLAFSLLSSKRSLDLVCAKKDDFDLWIRVLKRLPVCSVLHDKSEPVIATPSLLESKQDIIIPSSSSSSSPLPPPASTLLHQMSTSNLNPSPIPSTIPSTPTPSAIPPVIPSTPPPSLPNHPPPTLVTNNH